MQHPAEAMAMNQGCKWCAMGQCWGCKGSGKGGGGKGGGKGGMGDMMQVMNWFLKSKGGGKGGYKQNPEGFHDTSGGILGEHVGTISKRGGKFGFIESDVLKSMGYASVFCLGSELKDYKQDPCHCLTTHFQF